MKALEVRYIDQRRLVQARPWNRRWKPPALSWDSKIPRSGELNSGDAHQKDLRLFGKANPTKVRVYVQSSPADVLHSISRVFLPGWVFRPLGWTSKPWKRGWAQSFRGGCGVTSSAAGEKQLDALQYNRPCGQPCGRFLLPHHYSTGNYREKEEDPQALGRKMALKKAVKTGRNSSLEPMNPL